MKKEFMFAGPTRVDIGTTTVALMQNKKMIHVYRIVFVFVILFGEQVFAQSNRPNVVLFLIDDMGVMDTSLPFLTDSDGNPVRYPLNKVYRTPQMERLAQRGIRFNNFCAMSVCSPTRISLMTGKNAARHRTTNWINPDQDNAGPQGPPNWNWNGLKRKDVTLPKLLHESGYRTMHIGKGHFGPRNSEGAEPTHLGFEVNVAGCSIGAPGSYYSKQKFGNANEKARNGVPHLEKYYDTETFLTEALTLEAKRLIDESKSDRRPFFLYFPHYAVHSPFNPDPRFVDHYTDSGHPKNWQAFASLVEGMDKSLGDVMDHLESAGIAENTLIIFMGDNGSDAPLGHQHEVACAAPLRGRKGSHYEGGMRVPFIAAWCKPNPGSPMQAKLPIPQNVVQSQQAAVYDLFPTLLSLAGVTPPPDYKVDGMLLNTLLTGKADPSRSQSFLMHYPHAPHRSDYFTTLRDGDWKVIYHYIPSEQSSGARYQLFNLKSDPFEQHDLTKQEPKQLRNMMTKLCAALEEHDAVYPITADTKQPIKPTVPSE